MHTAEKQTVFFKQWYRAGLFNLLLVATVGVLLRYKMVASLPWVDHKYFLHGHSHFAFSGWVSLILMTAIMQQIYRSNGARFLPAFRWILWLHLLSAYGMLLSFPFQGYAALSISFSTLSIFISYAFVWKIWKHCNASVWGSHTTALSIRAALVFLVVSSLGAFGLALLMALHAGNQSLYFSALYFFLHFQYNGWFFFGILGLWLAMLPATALNKGSGMHRGVVWMIAACGPAVLLSGLWMKVPFWVLALAIAAALMQCAAVFFVRNAWRKNPSAFLVPFSATEKWLLGLSGTAFFIRICLQALSTIPALSKFAFAYRPVVIGYLHLILLGCISLFLLAYLWRDGLWKGTMQYARFALFLFMAGFLATEGTLMLQGFGYIGWISIPYTNEVLFVAALLLFSGIALLFGSAKARIPAT